MRGVKRALTQARAAVVLDPATRPDADKLAAIAIIARARRPGCAGLLSSLPSATSPRGHEGRGRQRSQRSRTRLAIWDAVQNAWYGLSLGSVLLLAAIGLAITFGVMGVINMAHGEMVMLGAYTTYVVQDVIRASDPALFD